MRRSEWSSRSPRDPRVPRPTPFGLSELVAAGRRPTAETSPRTSCPGACCCYRRRDRRRRPRQQALRTSTTPPATVGVVVGLDVVLFDDFGEVVLVEVGGAVVVVDGLGVVVASGGLMAACTISRIFE